MKKVLKQVLLLFVLLSLWLFSFIYAQETETKDEGTPSQDVSNDVNLDDDLTGLEDDLNLEDDLWDDLAGEEGNTEEDLEAFGYTDQDEVIVKEVGTDYAVLEAPVVKLSNGDTVKQYKVYYSTQSLATSNIDATKIKSKTFTFDTINGDKIELKVDGLAPGTTYYAVVVPVNAEDVEGTQSKEVTFTTKKIEDKQQEEKHPAAEVEVKNVTYTISGNKVTVKWAPVQWADNIEIYMKALNDENYEKVATVPANTTTYTVEVSKPGEYQIKLTPVDKEGVPVGKDYILTVKVASVPKKTPKKAPKVWPETNLIVLLLILASIWYFVVRYRRV